ncbi:purine nucleoside permease [Silvibacterium dinghuense]|uniref:Purine nucleoside permease n=1 Tax=Silvibacterium dinghuense TaxID=1560006 RepID=A0A4Q1SB03_9BACT|nr:purine nucleoside permease [Silvibacterium dinghuense]RXS94321.1 purine nucleoside permease [Silvibacterium dinghuense]GGH16912.1 purine nucleoside permease [Silvibacterium dinghuense]
MILRRILPGLLLCLFAFRLHAQAVASIPNPIPIKVVIVAMYEQGEDTGDVPGEYQYWVERMHLDRVLPLDAGYHHLRMNNDGMLAVLTGVATAKAAATIMALGLDPRFDLSHAYWLVAGIAGGDPADVSLGSAVWVQQVIDGEIAHELDAREIPADWPTGIVPLRRTKPYEEPADAGYGELYELNPGLTRWAFQLTKSTPLADDDRMREKRSHFAQPAAQRPPFVTTGDEVSSSTYWHGAKLDTWANAWTRYYTGGKGNFMVSGMEDSGTLQSLTFLAHAGKVDERRVLVLRTVSNYDQPPVGMSAAESLTEQKVSRFGAYLPSLEAAYAVGRPVVDAILAHWSEYRDHPPSASE